MPLPQQMNNDIAAQMQDMMNKSPGDVNNFEDQKGLHHQGFGPIDEKIREFGNAVNGLGLLHRGVEGNNVMDDKNYEEGNVCFDWSRGGYLFFCLGVLILEFISLLCSNCNS